MFESRWLIGFLALGAALIGCEGLLRTVWGLGSPILIQTDPSCGYILKPSQNVHRFFVNTRINRYGMRSEEVPVPRPADSTRLLFVGDSITYGTTQVDQSAIFTELVHRNLSNQSPLPVDVLNASASAWAITNEVAYVKSRGTFGSDLIILVLNSGDLAQPFATISDVGDGLPTRKPATAIGELWSRFLRPRLFRFAPHGDAGTTAGGNNSGIIARNTSALTELAHITQTNRARLAVLYIPFRRDIRDSSTVSMPIQLQTWANQKGVPALDLTAAESSSKVEDITLQDHTHLNSRGNKLVADAITPWLHELLKSGKAGKAGQGSKS